MAIRSVATTDTLDTFRTTFNSLAATDLGDVATLSTSASSIVGAVNELNSSVAGDLVIQTFGHRYNSDGSNTYTEFAVTVATKTSTHIYFGQGSANGYLLNNSVAPFIDLKVGNTYRFTQEDSTNSGHPVRFYYDKDKTTEYTTGVTTAGTPGNSGAYSQIVVSETTPNILYYMCQVHGLMGSRMDIDSSTNVIDSSTAFVTTTGTAINFASTNFAIAQAVALG
tara:strand:- start:42 stop:713 length:672 start_codon:yes stop_codon:yes gene_type:complete